MLAMLVLLAQASTFQVPNEVLKIDFANADGGLIVQTRGTPDEERNYVERIYYVPLDSLKPRLIAKGHNLEVGDHGHMLVTTQGGGMSFYHLPDGRKMCSVDSEDLGVFSPDGSEFAYTDSSRVPRPVRIVRIQDGRVRRLARFQSGMSAYAPKNGKSGYLSVAGWTARGIWIHSEYSVPGHDDRIDAGVYVDPVKDRIVSKAPSRDPELAPRFRLGDGSVVYDQSGQDDVTPGPTEVVRINGRHKRLLFRDGTMMGGSSWGASVLAAGNRVVVYGATGGGGERGKPQTAYIWSIDPQSGRRKLVFSGRYKRPPVVEGNPMEVALSSDGKRVAYADFVGRRRVHIRRL